MNKNLKWLEIDWGQPTTTIAREMGRSVARVSQMRKQYAPETLGENRISKPRATAKWSQVDWTKPNRQIARELDVSETSVRRNRNKVLRLKVNNKVQTMKTESIDKTNKVFVSSEDLRNLFIDLIKEEAFFKDKSVNVKLSPESYLMALRIIDATVSPVRLRFGDYKIFLHC